MHEGGTMINRKAAKDASIGIGVIFGALIALLGSAWGLVKLFNWAAEHHTLPYVFVGIGLVFVAAIWVLLYFTAKSGIRVI